MAAKKKGGGQVYVAKESGHADIDGQEYAFHAGRTRVDGDSVLAKKYKDFDKFFESADEHLSYATEQATAAPGERRDVFLAHETGQNEAENVTLEEIKVVELRQKLAALGGTPGTKNKAELIEAIEDAEADEDEDA